MGKKKKRNIARRCTVDLSVNANKELERMMRLTGLSIADIFRFSIMLFKIYMDARRHGQSVEIHDPKEKSIRVIEIPIQ